MTLPDSLLLLLSTIARIKAPLHRNSCPCSIGCAALVVFCIILNQTQLLSTEPIPLWEKKVFASAVRYVMFSPDSSVVVAVNFNRDSIVALEAHTGQTLWKRSVSTDGARYSTIRISPGGTWVATIEDDIRTTRSLTILDAKTGEKTHDAPIAKENIYRNFEDVTFTPDGRSAYIVETGQEGNAGSFRLTRRWHIESNTITDTVQFQPNDYLNIGFATGINNLQVMFMPGMVDTLCIVMTYAWEEGEGIGKGFSITRANGGAVYFYDIEKQRVVYRFMLGRRGEGTFSNLLFSSRHPLMAYSYDFSGSVQNYIVPYTPVGDPKNFRERKCGVLDVASQQNIAQDTDKVARCFLYNDNYLLLNTLEVWDYYRKMVAFSLPIQQEEARHCIALPGGNYVLFAGGNEFGVGLYNVAERRWEEKYGMQPMTTIAASPSFTTFASGDGSGWVTLWNLAEWAKLPVPVVRADFAYATTSSMAAVHTDIRFINHSYPLTDKARFLWNFGDGTDRNTVFQPIHVYEKAGTYIVRLVVENSNMDIDTVEHSIVIIEPQTVAVPTDPNSELSTWPIVLPNPFGVDGCTIHFALPEPTEISLSIVNSAAEEVTVLCENQLWSAGTHSLHWNACAASGIVLPSGIYYCIARIGMHQSVMPLLLIR